MSLVITELHMCTCVLKRMIIGCSNLIILFMLGAMTSNGQNLINLLNFVHFLSIPSKVEKLNS